METKFKNFVIKYFKIIGAPKELLDENSVTKSGHNEIDQYSVFLYAVSIGNILAVKFFAEIFDKKQRVSPIVNASKHGHLKILEFFFQKKNDWANDEDYNDAFIEAISNDHSDIVIFLLEKTQVDPSFNNNQAIKIASKNNFISIFRILKRDKRVNVYFAAYEFVVNGQLDILQEMAKDDIERFTEWLDLVDLLKIAISNDRYDIVKWMISTFNIEEDAKSGYLDIAAEKKYYKIFEFLLWTWKIEPSNIPYEFKTPELRAILAKFYKKQRINGRIH
jgi:predicted SnoaL-like aldol condensation-catalyzing enzyme